MTASAHATVAVLGAHGQLGAALLAELGDAATALPRERFDLEGLTPDRCQTLAETGATHVVNCAAYNAVDACETDPDLAIKANAINGAAPGTLAKWCRESGVRLVHLSTDYVFTDSAAQARERGEAVPTDGWTESDLAAPLGVYASSKFVGETLALEQDAIAIRTCGLYGRGRDDANVRARGGNFVETMLRLGSQLDEVRVVADQTCTPTSCDALAGWIAALIRTDAPSGLYHATDADSCTWADLAEETFRLAGLSTGVVRISTEEFGAAAPRPEYSVLDCGRLDRTLGFTREPWPRQLARYLKTRP